MPLDYKDVDAHQLVSKYAQAKIRRATKIATPAAAKEKITLTTRPNGPSNQATKNVTTEATIT